MFIKFGGISSVKVNDVPVITNYPAPPNDISDTGCDSGYGDVLGLWLAMGGSEVNPGAEPTYRANALGGNESVGTISPPPASIRW